LPNGTVAN